MEHKRFLPGLALACLSLLSACGGGGGDDGPGVVSAAPPPAVTPSPPPSSNPLPPPAADGSLLPEPGVAGAVLYADAAPLRVLRSGATWTYRGIDEPGGAGASGSVVYTNKVSFTGSDIQGLAEQNTNLFNDGEDSTSGMRYEGGAYKFSMLVDYLEGSAGLPETVTELRSPVRVNDLYGSVERKNVDIGVDLDGDRLNETASIALYSRVVAREPVDLSNRKGVEAVRVDMTMRVRLTPSTTRVPLPDYEAVQSTWYAPGIGVVKRRLEEPNETKGFPNRVVTEVLENWDGVSEGLGYLPTRTPLAPAASLLAGSVLQYPVDAVGFDTHAVVAAYVPNQPLSTGLVLAQLDTEGSLLAARSYTAGELFPNADYIAEPRLLRSADVLRLVARTGNATVSMVTLDATGQRIVRPAVVVMNDPMNTNDGDRSSFRVVPDGSGFWYAWLRGEVNDSGQRRTSALVVRMDGDAAPQSAARLVFEPVMADIHNFTMALDGKQLGFSWRQGNGPFVRRLASFDTASMTVQRHTLDLPEETCRHAYLVNLRPGLAVTCWSTTLSPVSAARLDAAGQPLLATGATLADAAIKAPWLVTTNGSAQVSGGDGELNVVIEQYAPYRPGEIATGFTTIFRTSSAAGSLTAREPVLLARIPSLPSTVDATVQLGNRLLLIGRERNGYLSTTVVWLAK